MSLAQNMYYVKDIMRMMRRYATFFRFFLPILLVFALFSFILIGSFSTDRVHASGSLEQTFTTVSQEFNIPVSLLKAICYMEGRLSTHSGTPSIDGGYGCMHLMKNKRIDTLDRAAHKLGVSLQQLKYDMGTNIRGGATILRDDAMQLSSTHTIPTDLANWYGALATYSGATTRSTALMYADAVYKILNRGFVAQTDTGETISLSPQAIRPNTFTGNLVKGTSSLPSGCTIDSKVDYPGAIDCILNPNSYDCNVVPSNNPCNYLSANRPTDYKISQVVIHDIEGSALSALSVFQDVNSGASVQYIVDSDGTVYQVVHEKDIAYHAGNFWYNEHSVGIENAGFDANGYQWYNATEYLASAKLTAYLLQKYNLPLDHDHVVAHGTIPSPFLSVAPNHVDPGPYWLWDYYFALIHQQGVPFPTTVPTWGLTSNVITLQPKTDQQPLGPNGTETSANFNFFYLYNGPSTASGLIPQQNSKTDITDVTDNVEPDMSYFYLTKVLDPAGTGDTMYEIWYGEENLAHASPPSLFANASLAWLAVPPGAAVEGQGAIVNLNGDQSGQNHAEIYGRPTTSELYHIGDAPNLSTFVSAYSVIEDGTNNLWYEINYNHRQAWVHAAEVSFRFFFNGNPPKIIPGQ